MKVNMNIMKKSMTGAFLALAAVSTGNIEPMEACTRAVYIGPEQMVITGRTMDWKEDIMSNIYVFPRGGKGIGRSGEVRKLRSRKRRKINREVARK